MKYGAKVIIDGISYSFLILPKGIDLESIIPITENVYIKHLNGEWTKAIEFKEHLGKDKLSEWRFFMKGIRIKDFKLEIE